MTYVPHPPDVRRGPASGLVTVTVPQPVVAAILTELARTVDLDQRAADLWDDLAWNSTVAWDDQLDRGLRGYAEANAASNARDLLDHVTVDDTIELAWPTALRLIAALQVAVAEARGEPGQPAVEPQSATAGGRA